MQSDVYEIHGQRILELPAAGPLLRAGQDANDLIGEAKSSGASLVVLPIARLDPAFFELRTGVAGDMVQKFVTYQVESARLRLVPRRQECSARSAPDRHRRHETGAFHLTVLSRTGSTRQSWVRPCA